MPLDKTALLNFLEELNNELGRKITFIAVGGTAMTLLDLRPSTIDIDFTIPSSDFPEYKRAEKNVPHGYKIDVYQDGCIFSQNLPDDYLTNSIEIANLERISLRALHPVDIVATKIVRLNDRDLEDIGKCIEGYGLKKEQIENRAANVAYIGKQEYYDHNLKCVLKKFFR
ncbi:MAG: DUF6036 family nucleotidyltransferase [Candidatus Bathyarchaeia archaeon]|jgi:hypothetical protein